MRTAYETMVRKPKWKKPRRRSWCRCEDNIKIEFKKMWTAFIWLELEGWERGNKSSDYIKVGDF